MIAQPAIEQLVLHDGERPERAAQGGSDCTRRAGENAAARAQDAFGVAIGREIAAIDFQPPEPEK